MDDPSGAVRRGPPSVIASRWCAGGGPGCGRRVPDGAGRPPGQWRWYGGNGGRGGRGRGDRRRFRAALGGHQWDHLIGGHDGGRSVGGQCPVQAESVARLQPFGHQRAGRLCVVMAGCGLVAAVGVGRVAAGGAAHGHRRSGGEAAAATFARRLPIEDRRTRVGHGQECLPGQGPVRRRKRRAGPFYDPETNFPGEICYFCSYTRPYSYILVHTRSQMSRHECGRLLSSRDRF